MGHKIFFVVANKELVMQTYDKFKKAGLCPSIIKAGLEKYYMSSSKIQIIMIQSYIARLNKLSALDCSVAIIDEVDWGHKGGMIKKLREKHPNAQIIGLTGTPCDFKGYLLDGFDVYHTVTTVRELQKEGFLAKDRNFVPLTPDLTGVRIKSTGDFNEKDLDKACNQTYIINDIVESYKKIDCGYKGIVFAINIEHGEKLRDAFLNAGIKAALVHSKMKKFQNQYWLDAIKNNRIQLIVNVGMLGRGWDLPEIRDVIMARSTLSVALYQQFCGRGARICEGKKDFRIIDYAGNIERHGLWSEPRLYSKNNEPKKEHNYPLLICPNCFSVIYDSTNRCPECDFILKAQQEKREREIQENLRVKEIVEIKNLTGSIGAIDALTKLLGRNGNTFYYTKLLSMKPERIPNDTFNSEVIRLANYARRKHYNPNYVYYKIKEKINA